MIKGKGSVRETSDRGISDGSVKNNEIKETAVE